MTAAELLTSRFEVLMTYPGSSFVKGHILFRIKNATNDWYHINQFSSTAEIHLDTIRKYPHIFRELKWYEFRFAVEMPKKIISPLGEVFEIEKWDMVEMVGIDKEGNADYSLELVDYEPID